MFIQFWTRWINWRFAASILVVLSSDRLMAQQRTVVLKNSMVIGPGVLADVSTVGAENADVSIQTRTIKSSSDELRFTFFNENLIANEPNDAPQPFKPFKTNNEGLKQKTTNLRGVIASGPVTEWDSHGRRRYTVTVRAGASSERREVVQGITSISPQCVKVEALEGPNSVTWEMNLAFGSIPAEQMRSILYSNSDLTDPNGWLEIVSLYRAAKRFKEAKLVLEEGMRKLPELQTEGQKSNIKRLEFDYFNQMFTESQLRAAAGQFKLAEGLLRGFPMQELALETKLKIERQIQEYDSGLKERSDLVAMLRLQVSQLNKPEDQQKVQKIVDEIAKYFNANTESRLADFRRLATDSKMELDQRVALALGGWLFGGGSGQGNFAVVKSGLEARDLVRAYLRSTLQAERESLLEKIRVLEAGTVENVAKILAHMLPPIDLPPANGSNPGRFLIDVPLVGDLNNKSIPYYIQLPPEYDPYRKYPCVVALHGERASPERQLEWWTGPYEENYGCIGEASRRGYIVVAPAWMRSKQIEYEYTENEHNRILTCLRDAMRRTSIDTDRIFLSGHNLGGDAAWDMGLAHPDIWAGIVCINANSDKYIKHYEPNAHYVPMYFVYGDSDGNHTLFQNGPILDKYLQKSAFDSLVVIYRGRGGDHFQEELPRMMEWMSVSSHRRKETVNTIEVRIGRPGDNFFWWLEARDFSKEAMVHPLLPERTGLKEIKASRFRGSNSDGFRIESIPAKGVTLWFNPDVIDFKQKTKVTVTGTNGKSQSWDVQSDLKTLLEDTRTRADRMHPFWAKYDLK